MLFRLLSIISNCLRRDTLFFGEMSRCTIKYAVHLVCLKLLQSRQCQVMKLFLYHFRMAKLCMCQVLRNYKDCLRKNLVLSALWHLYIHKLCLNFCSRSEGIFFHTYAHPPSEPIQLLLIFLYGICHLLQCIKQSCMHLLKTTLSVEHITTQTQRTNQEIFLSLIYFLFDPMTTFFSSQYFSLFLSSTSSSSPFSLPPSLSER